MFVLPPPPRYPSQMLYNNGYIGGQIVPMIETNNILTNPTGPDCQFLVGEGLYVLEEDLLLATPPPHPSEAPVINPNPLATTPLPASAGTKISMLTLVDPPRPQVGSIAAATAGEGPRASTSAAHFATVEEHPDGESSSSAAAGAAADSATGRLSFNTTSAMSGGSDTALVSAVPAVPAPAPDVAIINNPLTANNSSNMGGATGALAGLAGMGGGKGGGGKHRKPKNSVTKSNSSFISRVIVHDGVTKRIQERPATGLFIFANINRAFQWLDMSWADKKHEYLTKILFTKAHALCHDVNKLTKSTSHIDVIMGFSTGEIIWFEPISQRYTRINKNGIIRGTPVSEIRWIPGSENLFMAAFMDGSLVVFDKEKEDAAFAFDEDEANRKRLSNSQEARTHIEVERSIHTKNQKTNPFAFWKLSNQRINAFAFAPGQQSLLAVVSEDGSLRIIDYLREELIGLFYSYYGGLTCVCWSPDGKYVVTGGQDDLLSIWCVADSTLVARCQGHHSWVTSVAFDPWRCDDRVYRIGSVGEDGRLCLWDFSMSMLIRPKAPTANSSSNIHTAASNAGSSKTAPGGEGSSEDDTDGFVLVDNANGGGDERVHAVGPRARTSMLPPICSQVVEKEPLCWLDFTERSIVISSKTGHVRTWKRPTDNAA